VRAVRVLAFPLEPRRVRAISAGFFEGARAPVDIIARAVGAALGLTSQSTGLTQFSGDVGSGVSTR